jgi:hypothetical protein
MKGVEEVLESRAHINLRTESVEQEGKSKCQMTNSRNNGMVEGWNDHQVELTDDSRQGEINECKSSNDPAES